MIDTVDMRRAERLFIEAGLLYQRAGWGAWMAHCALCLMTLEALEGD